MEEIFMIKLVVLDVDGTLTDGKLYIDNMGNEMKAFDVKDGLAISQSIKQGIKFAIITGKTSKIVERRGKELGIQEIVQGSWDKVADFNEMKAFDVKDGLAISQSIKQGIKFAIITGKTSKIVERRGKELGIQEIVQGSWDKTADLKKILEKYNISFEETAYIGDDLRLKKDFRKI